MEYAVRHRTSYRYLQDVSYSCHLVHLTPRPTPLQRVLSSNLVMNPQPADFVRGTDAFGNVAGWFSIEEPHRVFEIVAQARVVVAPPRMIAAEDDVPWERVREILEAAATPETRAATHFLFDSPLTAARADLAGYALTSFAPGRGILSAAAELTSRIHRDFRYDPQVTDTTTTVDRVFEIRAGVCQDLAHVAISALRAIGLAGRYVSGYLLTVPPPGQPRLVGADASHAWFSVWVPKPGWIDFDPTNNIRAGESHITVAWGRDYTDVPPIGGVIAGGGNHFVDVGVDVVPATSSEGG
jgi:transglutaminase-like putative cysteine protease